MINIRRKERQTGKTTDIMELTEILLSLGRSVVLFVHNRMALEHVKKNYRNIFGNDDHFGYLLIGETANLDFLRGHKFDTILIDEWTLAKNKDGIEVLAKLNNAVLYATDDTGYQSPIFGGKPI